MPRSVLEYFSASQPLKALRNLTNDLWNIIESNFQTVSLIGCNLTFCYKQNIKSLKPKHIPHKVEQQKQNEVISKERETWITFLSKYIPIHCSDKLEGGMWANSQHFPCSETACGKASEEFCKQLWKLPNSLQTSFCTGLLWSEIKWEYCCILLLIHQQESEGHCTSQKRWLATYDLWYQLWCARQNWRETGRRLKWHLHEVLRFHLRIRHI